MTIADAGNTPAPPALASPVTSAPSVNEAEASLHLHHRLVSRWDDFRAALDTGDFYIELVLAMVAIVVAVVVAKYVTTKIRNRITASPPKFIDIEFLIKPLLLLSPTLMILFLGVVQAFAIGFDLGGGLTGGIIELCYAYWLTKCVMLTVKQKPIAYVISGTIVINAILRATRISRVTTDYLDSIALDMGTYHITALHLVHGIIIFIVVFWGAGLLSRTLESYLERGTRLSANTRHLTVKFFKVFLYIGAFAITLSAIGIDLTAFAIFTGALGVGIGLGLQKLTANFVSGVTVMMERSVKIGDLIEVGGQTGWVRQLNMRYVLLETSDGREVLIPNEELISSRVVNWTLTTNLVRLEIKVGVAFDSDATKTRELLLTAAKEHPRCLRDPEPVCLLREFGDHGLNFTLSFWISDVRLGRNGPQSDVMFAILEKFKANQIVLAHG